MSGRGNVPIDRPKVGAVVVSYDPDPPTLRRAIHAVAPQVDHVTVVDNAGGRDSLATISGGLPGNVRVLSLPKNLGVAAAQNAGIAEVRKRSVEFVLLLDQDSVCGPSMVAHLVEAAHRQAGRGIAVSAVGPQYRPARGDRLSGFVRFGSLGFRRQYCPSESEDTIEADFLISSGALLPISAVDRVGSMEEELFIDHVDTEWFLRARDRGLRCFGVCAAVMEHELGEGAGRIWFGRWRRVPHHRPFRSYYVVRNSLMLYRRRYAPARWIVGDFLRLLGLGLFNLALREERMERLRMMALGLRDGISGQAGPSRACP